MYGADDASDFSVSVSPISSSLTIDLGSVGIEPLIRTNASGKGILQVVGTIVKVQDFHHYLRPYRHKVFLSTIGEPRGLKVEIFPQEIETEDIAEMTLVFYTEIISSKNKTYPITIQGMGGDGRKRNTTYFLRIAENPHAGS